MSRQSLLLVPAVAIALGGCVQTKQIAGVEFAPPQGDIVIIVAPRGEAAAASEDEVDTALREALKRLPPAKAAGEVAKALGADRKALYARAMALKSDA